MEYLHELPFVESICVRNMKFDNRKNMERKWIGTITRQRSYWKWKRTIHGDILFNFLHFSRSKKFQSTDSADSFKVHLLWMKKTPPISLNIKSPNFNSMQIRFPTLLQKDSCCFPVINHRCREEGQETIIMMMPKNRRVVGDWNLIICWLF